MNDKIIDNYDVAISYLQEDEELAYSIYTELGEIFKVFIYTQHQKELVGKGGVETLRDTFINRTNLIVILFRKGWGDTGWTSTEEKAIIDFGLKNRWKGMLLINLDGSKTPDWYPDAEIYLDHAKYGNEQLIGVIKSRAEERGSVIREVTALDQAHVLQIRCELAQKRRTFLNSEEGVNAALEEAKILFEDIERICNEITSGQVNFEHKKKNDVIYNLKGFRHDDKGNSSGLEVIVQWDFKYKNSLDQSKLMVSKIDLGRSFRRDVPKRIEDLLFDFDVTPAMENCWRDNQTEKLIMSDKLADDIVKMIIDFMSC